jgi:hypothetical protein
MDSATPEKIGKIRRGSLNAQELSSYNEITTPAFRKERKIFEATGYWLNEILQELSSEEDSSSDNENRTPADREERKFFKATGFWLDSIAQELSSEDDSSSDEKGEETNNFKENDIVEVVKDKNAVVIVELDVSTIVKQFANEKDVTANSEKSSVEADDKVCYKETDELMFDMVEEVPDEVKCAPDQIVKGASLAFKPISCLPIDLDISLEAPLDKDQFEEEAQVMEAQDEDELPYKTSKRGEIFSAISCGDIALFKSLSSELSCFKINLSKDCRDGETQGKKSLDVAIHHSQWAMASYLKEECRAADQLAVMKEHMMNYIDD